MTNRLFFVCLLGSFLIVASGIGSADEPAAKAPEVPVARAVVREVTDHEDFVGHAEASRYVDLRARVSGYLLKASFQEGAEVKQGDLLFEIDSRPYQPELEKAEAAVALAEARLKLAEAKLKRAKMQLAQKTIGQEEFDVIVAEREEAQARVRVEKAIRAVAQLNMDFTRVRAPISGRISRRLVDADNLVEADKTILATLVNGDPMYVLFDVDERSYLHLIESMPEGRDKAKKLPVAIRLANEEEFSHSGTVDYTDNQLNADRGTVRMRAVLANKDELLKPGLFVRVRLTVGVPHKIVLIPEQAVLAEEGTRFVYVVNDTDAVEEREVVLGQGHDGRRVVTRGLKADERVIIGRQHGLRPGMTVRPREQETPPKPKKSSESGAVPDSLPPRTRTERGILVEAVYPGANASTVSDTVRAPIEQQVTGTEKVRLLRSRCTSDGRYVLAVPFAPGMSLDMAQVLVQNRVALALPMLPVEVQDQSINIRKATSGVLMIVNLSSPNGDYDSLYLSNYADLQIKDELGRLPGVGAVSLLGQSDYVMRIRLDPEKLAARKLSAAEAIRALKNPKLEATASEFADLILRNGDESRMVRLKDVATVEVSAIRMRSQASFNGKPVVALLIHLTEYATPRKTRAAVQDALVKLRTRLPKGFDLDTAFDFTANLESPNRSATVEHLLLDLHLPAAASAKRIRQVQHQCETLLRRVPEVQDVLAMSANPFDLFSSSPCILVRLTPAEKRKIDCAEVAQAIRAKLDEIKEMTLRIRDLSRPGSFPRCGYPIDLAIRGPKARRVREFAKRLAERLRESKKLTDTWANPDSEPRLERTLEIDRTRAMALGLSLEDIFAVLQVYYGSLYVNDFNRFGRTWRVEVQADSGDGTKDLRKLQIRNARGQMIPLNRLVKVGEKEGAMALDFLDLCPMVEITANLNSEVKLDVARKLCEVLADEVRKEQRLSAEYRLIWLP